MKLLHVLRYFKYFLFSRHARGHGIHSPFVFKLVSETFRNKIESDIVFCIEKIRSKMISDPRSIVVNDLGAGSEKMKSSFRKVSDIARYSAVPEKYGIFLSNMSEAFAGKLVLELGTSLGISTMYLAAQVPFSRVYTIEGCRATAEIASENFREARFSNIKQYIGSFSEILSEIRDEIRSPGLVFIDGDHMKEPVIGYFNQIVDLSDHNTAIIIDDINLSQEMAEAWREIKEHEMVTTTVDIYRMGIVFLRKDINRYHYIIRY